MDGAYLPGRLAELRARRLVVLQGQRDLQRRLAAVRSTTAETRSASATAVSRVRSELAELRLVRDTVAATATVNRTATPPATVRLELTRTTSFPIRLGRGR